ncbi:MAG: bifunctional (p)ppGpp synthetase/guanosine-3',5'-bis(diphosphate) 3'-pyrophosphohydrolase [Magnetococcales bacterium]|nr:bifunctional (p)ppGpp synthetase/guanosine-3',5'-bis(diphosphate) 3'-pyrophosphohydrolase [Magnetococcales bacterium]
MHGCWSQEKYREALCFAAQAHLGQTLPGSQLPYGVHVVLVTMEVMSALAEEKHAAPDLAMQCALLHDVLEDTPTPFNTLAETFGLEVAQGVLALSKDPNLDKSLRMGDSLDRIQQQPEAIWMVKLADRIINLTPPLPSWWTPLKRVQYRDEANEILRRLAPASPFLANRLREKITHFDRLLP